MLTDIHPYLTGDLLRHLDAMGHSDAVVLADANFPAERPASRVLTFPGLGTPEVLAAVRTVVPLDDDPALDLMLSPDDDGAPLPVQEELIAAAGAGAGSRPPSEAICTISPPSRSRSRKKRSLAVFSSRSRYLRAATWKYGRGRPLTR